MFHILLHFIVPALVVVVFYRKSWRNAYLLLISTMIVDIDHLIADPIYDPQRCSIGFHPLHEVWFILAYFFMIFHPKTRLIGLGLTIHMGLDGLDCVF